MTGEIVRYKAGENTVELTSETVRKYLVSGGGTITNQEIMMFLKLCECQKLNPFLREVYLIKFGNKPATMVTGKETFLKRAYRHPKYRGHKTGISVDGQVAWAEVYVEGYDVPIRCEVDYNEYVGRKSDGTINSMWASKPNTMLKKVSLVQALREAFPESFGGMYSQEEADSIDAQFSEDITVEYISSEMVEEIKNKIKDTSTDEPKFLKYVGAESIDTILLTNYGIAVSALAAKEKINKEKEANKAKAEVVEEPDREPGSDDA